MLNIRGNYSNQFKNGGNFCQSCENKTISETQSHIYLCSSLSQGEIIQSEVQYEDLFGDNLHNQVKVSNILKSRLEKRTEILNIRKNTTQD